MVPGTLYLLLLIPFIKYMKITLKLWDRQHNKGIFDQNSNISALFSLSFFLPSWNLWSGAIEQALNPPQPAATVRTSIFIAIIIEQFLPSSTCIQLCFPNTHPYQTLSLSTLLYLVRFHSSCLQKSTIIVSPQNQNLHAKIWTPNYSLRNIGLTIKKPPGRPDYA